MTSAPHVVRRQTLELVVPSQDGAAALQEEAHRVYHERVVPAFDRVLTRYGSDDELLRIDRVELDLGVLTAAELVHELAARAETELERALAEEVAALRRDPDAVRDGRRLTAEAARLSWLRTFLETGTVPWSAPAAASADPAAALAEILDTASALLVETLRRSASPRVARRLVQQLPPALRVRLVTALAAGRPRLADAVDDWQRLLDPDASAAAGGEAGVEKPLPAAVAGPSFVADRALSLLAARPDGEPTVEALSRLLVTAVAVESRRTEEDVLDVLLDAARRVLGPGRPVLPWLEERGRSRCPRSFREDGVPADRKRAPSVPQAAAERSAADAPQKTAAERPRRGRRTPETAARETVPSADGQEARPPKPVPPSADGSEGPAPEKGARPAPERPASEADRPREILTADDSLFVDDAGLVLLAPYLPAYLRELALVEERAFVSTEAQERAVLLLRYLATGATSASEHLLALEKLLCGWPLEEPVRREIELSAAEEEQSRELLESVVRNWKALGKTSADGLRASFLTREGRLKKDDQGFHLTVARTGFDVLLEQLPWGIGLVLLPFMDRPLFVEW